MPDLVGLDSSRHSDLRAPGALMEENTPSPALLNPKRTAKAASFRALGSVGDQRSIRRNRTYGKVPNLRRGEISLSSQQIENRFPAPLAAGRAKFAKTLGKQNRNRVPVAPECGVHERLLKLQQMGSQLRMMLPTGLAHLPASALASTGGIRYCSNWARMRLKRCGRTSPPAIECVLRG